VYHCRKYPNFDDVRDIFWTHQNDIKLFNTFSIVFVLNSTYKTNKYRLSLLEFVGVTSTKLTFSITFVYMMSEKEDNIIWALVRCRDLLHSKDISPKVIVTDRDNSLMNVVDIVFLEASTLLCECHIERNVTTKCKMGCKVKDLKSTEVMKTVIFACEDIVNSDTEQAYIDNCNKLKVVCNKFPMFLEYVEITILGPMKEKVVKCHAYGEYYNKQSWICTKRLKKYLTSNMSDLSTNWKSVHNMLDSQHTQIHASFQTSMIMLEHKFKGKLLWSRLIRNISRNALHYLANEVDWAVECSTNKVIVWFSSLTDFRVRVRLHWRSRTTASSVWMKSTLTRGCSLRMKVILRI